MNQAAVHWMGIDVAKKTFDAALVAPGQGVAHTALREVPVQTFARDPQGVTHCLAWMSGQLEPAATPPTVRVVMEATGVYSIELTAWLGAQCPMLAPAIVNPEGTAAFIKSLGLRNKTDRMEARALAFYGIERAPAPYEPLTPGRRDLRELSRYRDALVREKVAEGNRSEQRPQTQLVRKLQQRRCRQRERDIVRIEAEMKRVIAAAPELVNDFELLVSIPGVGFITAAVILAEMGDLRRFGHARQATAFAGLTPRNTTSGTSVNGRPHLCKKGNSRIRRVLYLSALSCIRCNHALRAVYRRLLQHGKVPMLALGAIMRKLLTIMRALLISETPFEPLWKTPLKNAA